MTYLLTFASGLELWAGHIGEGVLIIVLKPSNNSYHTAYRMERSDRFNTYKGVELVEHSGRLSDADMIYLQGVAINNYDYAWKRIMES